MPFVFAHASAVRSTVPLWRERVTGYLVNGGEGTKADLSLISHLLFSAYKRPGSSARDVHLTKDRGAYTDVRRGTVMPQVSPF